MLQLLPYDDDAQAKLTPSAVVDRLNRFIVGQVRTWPTGVRGRIQSLPTHCLSWANHAGRGEEGSGGGIPQPLETAPCSA